MYETYIGKTIGNHIHGFKTRINNHIIKSRSGYQRVHSQFMSLIALKEITDN